MESKHIKPARLVDIKYGEHPTKEDIVAMYETISDYWHLVANLTYLQDSGCYIVLPSGDEIELNPDRIEAYLEDQAERQQEARDQAYYGGD